MVPRGSPLLEALWRPLRTLQEAGILIKATEIAAKKEAILPQERLRKDRPLVLTQVSPIFMFLAFGLSVCTATFVVEILKKRTHH